MDANSIPLPCTCDMCNDNKVEFYSNSILFYQPQGICHQGVVKLPQWPPSISLGMLSKFCRMWELKILWTGTSGACLGIPGLSSSPPSGDQLTAQHCSSPKCLEHMAADLMKRLQNQSSTCGLGCPGVTCTMDTLMFERGVCYGQTVVCTEIE